MRYLITAMSIFTLSACGGGPAPAPAGDPPASAPAHKSGEQPASQPGDGHGHHHHQHSHPGHAHADGEPAGKPHHAPGHHAHHHNHRFEDPEKWAQRWDAAERDAWQKPDEVLRMMALSPTDTVADIGAGTGYFAMRFARAVPQGKVYAVDLEPSMVEYLIDRADREKLSNVDPVTATVDNPQLPGKVNVVFLSNTYHHIGDRSAYFARVRDMLHPGGKVVIVDYKVDFDGPGPPKPMRLAPGTVAEEMAAAGYSLASRDDSLPRQYMLTFVAKSE